VVGSIEDPRLRYVYRANGGISNARNTGVEAARGEYVIFLDDDDRALPGWLGALDAALRREPAAIVCCGARYVDESGRLVKEIRPRPLGAAYGGYTGLFAAGTFAIERGAYLEAGGFASGLPCSHHTEFALRALALCRARGWTVASAMEPQVTITMWSAGLRRERSPRKLFDGANRILTDHAALLAEHPRMRANYLSIAGVAAARLGDYRAARQALFTAAALEPWRPKRLLRATLSVLPVARDLVWRTKWYREQRSAMTPSVPRES
jgi:glycosyltransferase involved in cell wall biosynthesis